MARVARFCLRASGSLAAASCRGSGCVRDAVGLADGSRLAIASDNVFPFLHQSSQQGLRALSPFSAQAAAAGGSSPGREDPKLPKKPAGLNAQAMTRSLKVPDLVSPELIAEPYTGPRERLPLSSWFTPSGWRARYERMLAGIKSLYGLAICQRNIQGFSMRSFKTDVIELYKRVNTLIAEGSLTLLKRDVTGKCFSLMKREMKGRERAKWAKVTWELSHPLEPSSVEVLQSRLLALDPNNTKTHFVQITVRLQSQQRFAAYDKRGARVAGDSTGDVLVEDIWVVERAVYNPDGRWVLAARLTI